MPGYHPLGHPEGSRLLLPRRVATRPDVLVGQAVKALSVEIADLVRRALKSRAGNHIL